MKKVLITGAKGTVGKILTKGLKEFYNLSLVSLPEVDVRSYDSILKSSKNQDSIIHLAWNTKTENGHSKKRDLGNTLMWLNIYRVALENNIPRVIMASSIHATDYVSLRKEKLISVEKDIPSQRIYGQHKKFLEGEGKKYSLKGLEVICIRLGGIYGQHEKAWEGLKKDGLAYPDLVSLFQSCLDAESVPNNYAIIYGVSKNKGSFFDLSNPFNWQPKLDAAKFYDF
jgi:nucleoside-diphosphate-sugar epimerase